MPHPNCSRQKDVDPIDTYIHGQIRLTFVQSAATVFAVFVGVWLVLRRWR